MEPEEMYDYIDRDKLAEPLLGRPFVQLSTAGYDTSSSLTLASFLAQHSATLPVTMTACTSYNGGKISLCQGQRYVVLAVREQKCVLLKDTEQKSYILPLHSSILFGLVHHTAATPLNLAVFGIRYETADELMKLHIVPSVVCSINSYKSKYPDGCLDENELLVLQGLKTRGALRKGTAFQAYSVTHRCARSIGRHCDSGFTTHPERIKMALADITAHVPQPFPSVAVAYVQPDQAGLPRGLASKVVMLEKLITRTVMVVRRAEVVEGEVPFDLPVDTPVRVNRSDSSEHASVPRRAGSSDKIDAIAGDSFSSSPKSSPRLFRTRTGTVRNTGSLDRTNSVPPPLPHGEDVYDNEVGMTQYVKLSGSTKSDPITVPLAEKPFNALPKFGSRSLTSVEMIGRGSPSYVAVDRPDGNSEELIYDYANDEDINLLGRSKEAPPLSQPLVNDLEREMKELMEAIAGVQETVQRIKRSIQVCNCEAD